MSSKLDPSTQKHLAARVNYYREMGIYDFYRRPVEEGTELMLQTAAESVSEVEPSLPSPISPAQDKPAALEAIREDIGDCTRCRLHKGRTKLVFGVGNVNATSCLSAKAPERTKMLRASLLSAAPDSS